MPIQWAVAGPIIASAAGSAAGALLSSRGGGPSYGRQKKRWQNQLQTELAHRVIGAKNAGIHPLAALGQPVGSPPAVSIGEGRPNLGGYAERMGQDISRSLSNSATKDEKDIIALDKQIKIAELQHWNLKTQMLSDELNKSQQSPSYDPNSGIWDPNGGGVPGQGDAQLPVEWQKPQIPIKATQDMQVGSQALNVVAGTSPDTLRLLPNQDFSDLIGEHFPSMVGVAMDQIRKLYYYNRIPKMLADPAQTHLGLRWLGIAKLEQKAVNNTLPKNKKALLTRTGAWRIVEKSDPRELLEWHKGYSKTNPSRFRGSPIFGKKRR
jgi:hypothetical protein